jgi:hypothetical protein
MRTHCPGQARWVFVLEQIFENTRFLHNTKIFCAFSFLPVLLAMTDNDIPFTYPWLHLPDRLKLGLQRLRLEALESLQNFRAF